MKAFTALVLLLPLAAQAEELSASDANLVWKLHICMEYAIRPADTMGHSFRQPGGVCGANAPACDAYDPSQPLCTAYAMQFINGGALQRYRKYQEEKAATPPDDARMRKLLTPDPQ